MIRDKSPRSLPPTRRVARGPVSRHPSNGGELSTYHCGIMFLSAKGGAGISGPAKMIIFVGDRPAGGVVLCTTGGGEITSNELPVTSNEPPPIIIANKATRTGGKCCLCLFPLHWWNKKNVCIRRNMIYNRHSAGEKLFILAFYMECKNE